ncbi:DUF982 domain-containing protein (plasmid) [Mesorhizobium sp. INR15]|nr:DUF982 domain-containing protein [Mesorhizobium sp. INR15]QPC95617.1 DUF982 domain-containing protein [Mesorhizobium sp. INR15]
MSSRFVRPVVVQVGRHDRERIVFDVNDAAMILLRSFPHQTEKRKLAMDACLQVLRGELPVAGRRRPSLPVSRAQEKGRTKGPARYEGQNLQRGTRQTNGRRHPAH